MTFEEWFKESRDQFINDLEHFRPESKGSQGRQIAWLKAAWQAGYADGVEAMGGPINASDPNAGLPGTTEYTYEEFSRDSERW